jgi:hypothetical protein
MRTRHRLSKISWKKYTTTVQSPVLDREFDQAKPSRQRIASRTRRHAYMFLKYPDFRSPQ